MKMILTLVARFFIGVCWAVFLNSLILDSRFEIQTILVTVTVGLIATAMFGGPLLYAMTFWVPVVVSGFISIYFSYKNFLLVAIFCYAAYVFLTFSFIALQHVLFFRRASITIGLERTNETIRILLRDFEESASDWLWETDAELKLSYPSPRFAEAARRPRENLSGNLFAFLGGEAPKDRRGSGEDPVAVLRGKVQARLPFRDVLVPVEVAGERRWWLLTGKPITDHTGAFAGYRGVGSDVTDAERSRERIAYLAKHDPLTDLLNRSQFSDTLDRAVATAPRQGLALLYLDLDEFKAVNDGYGHAIGDSLLRAVANRIRATIRDKDCAARLGGDEFALMLPAASRDEAAAVAERVIDRIMRPFRFDGITLEIGVSIGIAMAPEDGLSAPDLLKSADLALYRAKEAGRCTWRVFDAAMDDLMQNRRVLRRDIRTALAAGDLFTEFQPIRRLDTEQITRFEALVRWQHPERGLIGPGEFIPIAEHSGLIGAVGGFVLSEAVRLALVLPETVSISVNLSPLQLREIGLAQRLHEIVALKGLPAHRIEFEVTESAVLGTDLRTRENLLALRRLGYAIVMDDFGTGFSSLATLREFEFDRIKIDRSFIAGINTSPKDEAIIRAIVQMSQALGLTVTAEGIETACQLRAVQKLGCDDVQGFFVARPMGRDALLELFARGRPDLGLESPIVGPRLVVDR